MCEYTKNLKLIGKGCFTKAFSSDSLDYVILKTTDPIKQGLAYGWISGDLFPKCEYLDYDEHNNLNIYKMIKYDKIRAPKSQLNTNSYKLYKEIREIINNIKQPFNIYDSYHFVCDAFDNWKTSFKREKLEILEALGGVSNFGSDVGIEVSPRNIANNNNGDIILLDCFYLKSELLKTRKSKSINLIN